MTWDYKGIYPALQVPFHPDGSIDEAEFRRFCEWLLSHEGIKGLVTNGHTGEVFALNLRDRTEVTRLAADVAGDRAPVISGICCEDIEEAVEHGQAFKAAGAAGALVMPPHMWLRFGMRHNHVVDFFTAIGERTGLDLVVHVYPAWTRAGYSTELMVELAKMPWVKAFKVGTREMSKYARDVTAIRNVAPEKAILTCHDEYLLASMVQGVDGALVGFASFIPDKITALYDAVKRGDLNTAMALQWEINPLKEAVYGLGEPTGDAHSRMKTAMMLSGRLKSNVVRAPTRPPEGAELEAIRSALANAGMLITREAAE